MNIFLLSYILILVVGLFCHYNNKRQKKNFCIFSGCIYFLLAALRSYKVGGDTFNYCNMFAAVGKMTVSQILTTSEKDPVFFLFLSMVRRITDNYTVLLIIVAAFFIGTVWTYIYRYSDDPVLSIIILLAFNLYQFSLTGMRQTIAMGFIVLAIMAMNQNKKVIPYLFVFIGSLFHQSALIFICIPLLRNYRVGKQVCRMVSFLLILCFALRQTIAGMLVGYLAERGYGLSLSDSGITMFLVIAFLFALAVLFMDEYKNTDENYHIQYYMGWLAVFFEILVTSQNIFFRIAFYFLISFITLIPNVVCRARNEATRKILKIGLYTALSIQYLWFTIGSCNILPYTTFWQI